MFASRFAKNLGTIFASASKCVEEDRFKVFRCFKLWKEGSFFPDEVIGPIVEKINAIESFEIAPDGGGGGGAGQKDADQPDSENIFESKSSPFPVVPRGKNLAEEKAIPVTKSDSPKKAISAKLAATDSPKVRSAETAKVRSAENVRFDKRLLDFDYSDDEDGDQRGARRPKKNAPEQEEDFFVVGKDGKPEYVNP